MLSNYVFFFILLNSYVIWAVLVTFVLSFDKDLYLPVVTLNPLYSFWNVFFLVNVNELMDLQIDRLFYSLWRFDIIRIIYFNATTYYIYLKLVIICICRTKFAKMNTTTLKKLASCKLISVYIISCIAFKWVAQPRWACMTKSRSENLAMPIEDRSKYALSPVKKAQLKLVSLISSWFNGNLHSV